MPPTGDAGALGLSATAHHHLVLEVALLAVPRLDAYLHGMRRDDALERLVALLPELRARYGVRALTLFGSTARDDARPDSDVDVVVDLGPAPTFDRLLAVVDALETGLGTKVDVLTPGALRPRLKGHVDAEGVRVA